MAADRFDRLREPLSLGGLNLKNRLVALPLFTGYAHPSGRVSRLQIDHYARLARSGPAMVVVGNVAVSEEGAASRHNLRLDRDDLISGLAELAGAIKEAGALACLQLNHAGRLAMTRQPLLPSPYKALKPAFEAASLEAMMNAFPFERRFGMTRRLMAQLASSQQGMSPRKIQEVISQFGLAAARAAEAGFDLVELHGATGYLLTQFLSAYTNQNREGFGGSFTARATFPLAVLAEVQRRLPPGFPVGFRILLREWVPEGIDLEEAIKWARLLDRQGIAYLSATAGTYNSLFLPRVRRLTIRPGYLRQDTATLKKQVRAPVIISGRVLNPDLALEILQAGEADLIGLARSVLADPGWIGKIGRQEKVRACLDCYGCLKRVALDRGLACVLWPHLDREKVDLEHRFLSRGFQGLWVAAGPKDLEVLQAALPRLLPRKPLHPTLLLLNNPGEDVFGPAREEFLTWCRGLFQTRGLDGEALTCLERTLAGAPDREVRERVEEGDHGVILIPRRRGESWRERVAYQLRSKVIGLIGSHPGQDRVLAPVDLSASTLLMLKGVSHSLAGKPGLTIDYVHLLEGPAGEIKRRWEEAGRLLGWEEEPRLTLLPSRGNVAQELLAIIAQGGYGTVVMGKRGRSRIKRWLLGSVSAGVLRGLKDQTLILVD